MLAVLQKKSDVLAPDLSNYGRARVLTYPKRVNTPSVDPPENVEHFKLNFKEIDEEQLRLYLLHKEIISKYFPCSPCMLCVEEEQAKEMWYKCY